MFFLFNSYSLSSMKKFILQSLLFFSPFIIITAMMIYLDPHKVFFHYDHYYDKDAFITPNREHIVVKTYLNQYKTEKYNAFVFGSSRAFSLPLDIWKSYLPKQAKPYLFNAFGDGIYGARNKIVFLDELEQPIKHALFTVDEQFLMTTKNRQSITGMSPPVLSKESSKAFYLKYINALSNGRFVLSYLDYSYFQTYRSYMTSYIRQGSHPNIFDPINSGLIQHGKNVAIIADSIGYYNINKFPDRSVSAVKTHTTTAIEIQYLKEVKAIFDKHQTQYQIIVHPGYDQVPLSQQQVDLLNDIFGKEHIHNFSGKNKYTEHAGDYYDKDHYRMHIGRQLLKETYNQ